jgi:HAE1 family hydrophobic/amphiphilic exporter-1
MNLREMIPRLAYDRPITVLMGFVACLVVGIVAYVRIPVQMFPNGFSPPFLWGYVPYPNSTPLEVDESLVRPIEGQLRTVSGIATLESQAETGAASFWMQFHQGADMDEAYNSVVDRLERSMPELPDDVQRFGVYRYNPNDEPIVWAGVEFPEEVDDPWFVMSKVVQPRIERIPGVAAIDLWGVPVRSIYVDYDKERVYSHGVNLGELQERLSTDNFQMSSGRLLEKGQVRQARSLSPIDSIDELRSFPVRGDIVLQDIAEVQQRSAYSTSINRVNGRDAAALGVRKESSANAVETSQAVVDALHELEADPRAQGARFHLFFSQGALIAGSMDTLQETMLVGGLLAVIVLYAFLRAWRATLLIAATIPFSALVTIGILYAQGGSLNLLSMMGLMLSVGMVVDNAIVVVEAIEVRRARGESPRDAAIGGTGEVNLAIISGTLTSMVVFLPVILMSESAEFSFFMGALGMPVVYSLGASLLAALVFAPLTTRFLKRSALQDEGRWMTWLTERYASLLVLSQRRRADSLLAMGAALMLTMFVAMPGVQCTDGDDGNLNDFTIRFTVPPQYSYADREKAAGVLEQVIEEHREQWGIRVYRTRLGGESNEGRLYVYLQDEGPMDREAVMEAAREAMPDDLPGVKTTLGWEGGFGSSNQKQLELQIFGDDPTVLQALADEVERRVRSIEGVIGVHGDSEAQGADEVRLVVDRDAAARYGVSAREIGNLVAYAMRGTELPPVRNRDREIDVVARFSLEDRSELDQLLSFDVWSPAMQALIPVRSVTRIEVGKGPLHITRRDGRTATSVTLDLAEDKEPMQLSPALQAAMADFVFPTGYGWSQGELFEHRQEEDEAIQFALLLSAVLVFLLIGMLFESWVLPLSIITTIPMAVMGALWGLYLFGMDMDMMAAVGMIILIGVVVNNGIVLIDLVTQLRAEGVPRHEAIVEAGRRRLRPILMTAMTTIFGTVPMVVGDASFVGISYAPLGMTLLGGMVTSTLLTLLFVPVFYVVLDDMSSATLYWFQSLRGGIPARSQELS